MSLCCIGSPICCSGYTCCKLLCCGPKACNVHHRSFPRLGFVVLDFMFVIASLILMYALKHLYWDYFDYLKCNDLDPSRPYGVYHKEPGVACIGTGAVMRMGFTLFLFHLITLLIILPRKVCSSNFHDGCWLTKFILICAIYVGVFFIPNGFYGIWAYISRIASLIFLLMQVVIIAVGAFALNDWLAGTYRQRDQA